MTWDFDVDELRRVYRSTLQDCFALLSPRARDVVETIIDHPQFPSATDPYALETLITFLRFTQPRRVLQLGTHIGYSMVLMGDILAHNDRQTGTMVTVEPNEEFHTLARGWAKDAGLADVVTFIDGFSTAPDVIEQIQEQIREHGPFDVIYLDSSHAYRETLRELDLIFGHTGWLSPDGYLLMHDASHFAERFDITSEGGVRKAIDEWIDSYPGEYYTMVFEYPLWPNGCGLGIMRRRAPEDNKLLSMLQSSGTSTGDSIAAQARIAELERQLRDHKYHIDLGLAKISELQAQVDEQKQALEAKNRHITSLEGLLAQIRRGRVMRLLRAVDSMRRILRGDDL